MKRTELYYILLIALGVQCSTSWLRAEDIVLDEQSGEIDSECILPTWQQELAEKVLIASDKISEALPLLPDDTPEAIEATKQHIKEILVTQPNYVRAWLRLAELMEEFPIPVSNAPFNATEFREQVELLLRYLEELQQEGLTDEELAALYEIENTTRFVLSDQPAGGGGSSGGEWIVSAMNAGWKLVAAFAVLYIGYQIVDSVKQDQKIDDVKFRQQCDEVRAELNKHIKTLQKQLEKIKGQNAANAERADGIITNAEAQKLERELKETEEKIKELEDQTKKVRRDAMGHRSLVDRLFGRKKKPKKHKAEGSHEERKEEQAEDEDDEEFQRRQQEKYTEVEEEGDSGESGAAAGVNKTDDDDENKRGWIDWGRRTFVPTALGGIPKEGSEELRDDQAKKKKKHRKKKSSHKKKAKKEEDESSEEIKKEEEDDSTE